MNFRDENQAIVKSALAGPSITCGEHSALAMAYIKQVSPPDFNVCGDNYPAPSITRYWLPVSAA